MAKKRKAEGIALLSVYNDEDSDVDMDEDEDEDEEEEEEEEKGEEGDLNAVGVQDDGEEEEEEDKEPFLFRSSTPIPVVSPFPSTLESTQDFQPPLLRNEADSSAHGIVDYAHDEAAASPEAEEGEILSRGWATYGENLQFSNGTILTGASFEKSQVITSIETSPAKPETLYDELKLRTDNRSAEPAIEEAAGNVDIEMSISEGSDAMVPEEDPLADFLPPPPTEKCSEELQNKFTRYLALKNAGRSFNEELRKSKGYRNPDFLQRAVKYQEIDQIGSCFRKEIFDPHGYDASDFYDALALELRREMERKEQEKKRNQRVDFVHGGTHSVSSNILPDNQQKPIIPIIPGQKVTVGVSTVNAQAVVGSTSTSTAILTTASCETSGKGDGKTSKKSKWDKVDNDVRPATFPGVKDTTGGPQAALFSAKAGAGYASFAQQKRKEAEERTRSLEKSILKSEKKAEKS